MPTSREPITHLDEDTVIESYEREFSRDTTEHDAEIARLALMNALFREYGEVRDGTQVIPGDQ